MKNFWKANTDLVLKLAFIGVERYYVPNHKAEPAMKKMYPITALAAVLLSTSLLSACTPTVQVAMPSEPITINLNVRIEHEIRVKVDQELEDVFAQNADLF